MVFFYHHDLLNVGWIGVDLFFVVSGYLITGILRRTRRGTHFWKDFWIKRATRILPPLLLLLAAVAFINPSRIVWIPALLLTLGDVVAYIRPHFEDTRPLWSLAVEDHLYLIWPFAVRNLPRRPLMLSLITLIVAEPFLRALAISRVPDWQFVYFFTPFRLDGISMGALLALLAESSETRQWLSRWSLLGLALVLAIFAGLRLVLGHAFSRGNTPFYNAAVYSLFGMIAFFLIALLVVRPNSKLARTLSIRPLLFLGRISYGLYLYQELIQWTLLRFPFVGWRMLPLWSGSLTLLAAWGSFTFYEEPLILWGKRKAQSYRPLEIRSAEVSPCTTP